MGLNNRWVNVTNQNYELEDILETFATNHFYTEVGREHDELKHKIEFNEIIHYEDINFIPGKFGFEYELYKNVPDIREEGIVNNDNTLFLLTHVLNFWIGDNQKFLFSSSKPDDVKGRNKLSQLLFNNEYQISEVNFNLEEIARAVYQGEFGNMWLTGFEDRNGNIDKGTLYGDNVNDDVMYDQIIDSIKNQIGVTHEIDNAEVKIRFTRNGTFQAPARLFDDNEPYIFNAINEFNDYIIIP